MLLFEDPLLLNFDFFDTVLGFLLLEEDRIFSAELDP